MEKGNPPKASELLGEQRGEASKRQVAALGETPEVIKACNDRMVAEENQKAAFARQNIESVEELREKLADVTNKQKELTDALIKFTQDRTAWEHQKEVENAQIKTTQAQLVQVNKSQKEFQNQLDEHHKQLEDWEKLLKDREENLNTTEKKELVVEAERQTVAWQLKTHIKKIYNYLGDSANIIIKVGFAKTGNQIWDALELAYKRWDKDGTKHRDNVVEFLQSITDQCNKVAVKMARQPRDFRERTWNKLVDNLEAVYKLCPALKPPYLPHDEDSMPIAKEAK